MLGLLPFFVLGLKATPERLEWLRTRGVRVAAVVRPRSAIVAATWFIDSWASTEWLYYRAMYVELTTSDLEAVAIRAGGAGRRLRSAPSRSWPSCRGSAAGSARMGSATLVVYLFHGFAVKGAEFAGFQGWAERHVALSLVLTTLSGSGAVAAAGVAARRLAADLSGRPVRLRRAARPACRRPLAAVVDEPIEACSTPPPDQPR